MAHDPITAATTTLAAHREPAFRHVDDIAAAEQKIAAYAAAHGRKPNVLVVLTSTRRKRAAT